MITGVHVINNLNNSYYRIKKENSTINHKPKQQLRPNSITFKNSSNLSINITGKHIDYGDIFRDGVNLFGKTLYKTNENGVKMRNANLAECNLEKSSFTYSLLDGTDFTRSNLRFSNFIHSYLRNIITKSTDFTCANLYGCCFAGDRMGTDTNMEKTNLCNADLENANINTISFYNAIYNNNTKFPTNFDPCKNHMRILEQGANFSNLMSALERIKLRYSIFENIDFKYSNLRRADIADSYFKNCDMHRTSLLRAYAKETSFENCDLTRSNLKQINLKDAELINCDLSNSNLCGAILKLHHMNTSKFKGAVYDQFTEIEGFDPEDYGMIKIISPLEYYGIRG